MTWERRFSMISSPSASLSASQYPSSRAAFSIVVVIFTTSSGLRDSCKLGANYRD